ncbi:response regulator transcription factor [Limisalsivibrio acetivorans]|uniref:response regulator transcription factor n=1 Tax=Limisalsivibrio acetivorans TaxID=1304888 RepID=UPI00138AD3E4|nr:response regulator [Limisalsivibrio acetivorans]
MLSARWGGSVYESADGKSALERYRSLKPDIVIADIKMPGMNGVEIAKEIRKNDKNTRIVITTAYTDNKYTLEAMELLITRYLVKPVSTKELFTALAKCVTELEEINPDSYELRPGLLYNKWTKTLTGEEGEIKLTNIECSILEVLIEDRGKVVRYAKFEDDVWNGEYMSKDTLRAHIKALRSKLGGELIKSSKSIGYMLEFYNYQNNQ